nr:hypothetical protein [Schaalia georgiae]
MTRADSSNLRAISAAASPPARKHPCAATSTTANTGATKGPTNIPSAPDKELA